MPIVVSPSSEDPPTELTLVRWLHPDGQLINKGESLAELESGMASIEISASETGILRQIAKVGDVITIATIEEFVHIEPVDPT